MTPQDDLAGRLRQQIEGLAREHLDPADAEYYLSLLRPAVRMEHADAQVGRSRLGGCAVLDDADAWPRWNGRPLSFVMVLDLADLAGMETDLVLPESGLLNFFYEADEQQSWGFDPDHADGWRVLPNSGRGDLVAGPVGALSFTEIPLRDCQKVCVSGVI